MAVRKGFRFSTERDFDIKLEEIMKMARDKGSWWPTQTPTIHSLRGSCAALSLGVDEGRWTPTVSSFAVLAIPWKGLPHSIWGYGKGFNARGFRTSIQGNIPGSSVCVHPIAHTDKWEEGRRSSLGCKIYVNRQVKKNWPAKKL